MSIKDEVKQTENEIRQAIKDEEKENQGGEHTDPWEKYRHTIADAYQERPPIQYAVDGLIELPSLDIFYGAPGSKKSFIMADMACCIAGGKNWLPGLLGDNLPGRKTKQGVVLWIDFDNGLRRTSDRFSALGKAANLPSDNQLLHYISMPSPRLDGDNQGSISHLVQLLKRLEVSVCFIDNLGVISGNAEENKAEMGGVMTNFRQVAEQTGAAIILIHHQTKGISHGRAGDKLRGHSSIEAALDLAICVELDSDDDSVVNLKSTKVRGAPVPMFAARFSYGHKPNTKELETACFFGEPKEDETAKIDRVILEVIGENQPANLTTILRHSKKVLDGVGEKKIRRGVARLEKLKKVSFAKGESGSKNFSLI